ncbi:hypothetical protein [Mycobacterium sp. 852014-52144_SCH5372336]|uniref:hypothetical protein n=1 Tax=Mycobacterium sp. 852014-52144_SCH5372336 TaxID=1834115 RepID=UPI0007FC440A|nr:hypothetical protein [Mycobacterium sp. 852014-52144_SCH5372336]OBB74291.1 hypothetical protein A5759_13810 [Mycobacterium sp. 852014-52144_SCH5372336]
MIVASIAVLVNLLTNRNTLRQSRKLAEESAKHSRDLSEASAKHSRELAEASATQSRVQFTKAREDARTEKLRAEIAALLTALGEREAQGPLWEATRTMQIPQVQTDQGVDVEAVQRVIGELEPLIEQLAAPLYRRISVHVLGVLMLTEDRNITGAVQRLEILTSRELGVVRRLCDVAKRVQGMDRAALLGVLMESVEFPPLRDQIEGVAAELRSYCLQKFPKLD